MSSLNRETRDIYRALCAKAQHEKTPDRDRKHISESVLRTVAGVMSQVIKADGNISLSEIRAVQDILDGMEVDVRACIDVWDQHWQKVAHDVPYFIEAAARRDKVDGTTRAAELVHDLNELALHVAAIDGEATDAEIRFITNYTDELKDWLRSENVPAEYEQGARSQKTLVELLEELNRLVGMTKVKKDVTSLVNLVKVRQMRERHGLKTMPVTLHLVFTGNPGTGKTTVARLLADIYRAIGLLKKGHLVETDRAGLIAGYMGQTAIKVQELVNKARGGVLFIDEAYTLTTKAEGEDYAGEAIATLLKMMEDYREELIVIVAGYTEPMSEFLASNPGLRSRFNKFVHFPDYLTEELYEIFRIMCEQADYTYEEETGHKIFETLGKLALIKDENFANARAVRNLFEQTVQNHANRVAMENITDPRQLMMITVADLPEEF